MQKSWIRSSLSSFPLLLLDPDTGAGGGGEEDDDEDVSVVVDSKQAIKNAYENKLARMREKNRTLRDQVTKLSERVAPEGAVVLSGKDVERWNAVKDWKDEPQAVQAAREQAEQRLAGLERNEQFNEAGTAYGYKPKVLARLESLKGKTLETREVQEGDGSVRRSFVKDGDKEHELSAFLTEYEADFLPALTVVAQQDSAARFVRQDAGGKPANKDYVAEASTRMQAQRDSTPSPLKTA